MIEAREHPSRGGWIVRETPGGPNEGWTRSAIRNGRELRQGAMDYHAFIVALERIAGIPCFADFIEGIQAGLDKDGAWIQAEYTTEEAWARALAQSEGRPWDREANAREAVQSVLDTAIPAALEAQPQALVSIPAIFTEAVPVEINITLTLDPVPAPVAVPAEDFIQAALARMKAARNSTPAPASALGRATLPALEAVPLVLAPPVAIQQSLFGEDFA